VLKLRDLRYPKTLFQHTALRRSVLAVSDQGVVSLGNFITGILLARHLPQSEFGTYALILGILLSANSLHSALIGQPLTVYGAQADAKRLRQLASGSLVMTIGVSALLNLGVVFALSVLRRPDLAVVVFGTSLLWQFQEVLRRSLLSQYRQGEAIWGDAISYLGQAVLVWLLIQQKWLSLDIVFIAMMLSSALAAFLQALQLKLRFASLKMIVEYARSFWEIGRWILLTNILAVILVQLFPWTLKLFHGPEATASFQVIVNVLGVSNPILFSLGTLIIPSITQADAQGNRADWSKIAQGYALPLGCILLLYYVVLIIWPQEILALFYGADSPYLAAGLETPLRYLVLAHIMIFFAVVLQSVLYGLKKTRAVFLVHLFSTSLGLVIGIPLASAGDVLGACKAIALIQFVSVTLSFWFLRNERLAQ
jgi:O-antigen/teichoic acid export membrane protein